MSTTVKRIKRGWLGGATTLTVTSSFGRRNKRMHRGIDLRATVGTAIYAPADGTVKSLTDSDGYGLYITLTGGGVQYRFAHLSSVVQTGSVTEGTLIAKTGGQKGDVNAGLSTGPHLHFEVRIGDYSNANAINPIYVISDALISKNGNLLNKELTDVSMIGSTADSEPEYTTVITDQIITRDNQHTINNETVLTETEESEALDLVYEEGLAAGIWQIVKIVLDDSVANLRIRDAATSIQQGALINFFNKVCQQPLVEFSGDTFGDQYYFLVRRPPFDYDGMYKALTTQGLIGVSDETGTTTVAEGQSIYEIEQNDMLSSNLSFNTDGIYSWYQYYPIYEFGATEELQYMIPAVLFPEYAAIWGSRDLRIRSQYRSFISSTLYDDRKNGIDNEQGDTEVRNSIKDLKYIIECNAYAPFVRRGTITILGNRKIKRGTFIRINWNSMGSEIFYVDSVSQSYRVAMTSVQRTTTLTVSRGMIEKYMFNNSIATTVNSSTSTGEADLEKTANYFNIINWGDYDNLKDSMTMDDWRTTISSWKVDTDIFQFFLRKLQFLTNIISREVVITGKLKQDK